MKRCSACKITKELDQFYANRASKDGLCGRCKSCDAVYKKSDVHKKARKARDQKNKLEINQYQRAYAKTNREKFNEYQRDYYYRYWEHNRKRINEYYARDDRKYANNAKAAKRRSKLAHGSFKAFSSQIAEIYRNCPVGYHVDHVVPINGTNVSGLHVPWNLQYLPSVDNLKKGNKFEG